MKELQPTEDYLMSLASRLHHIARDCFDLGTAERLRSLATDIERRAQATPPAPKPPMGRR
jgi:hypothetical protein